VFQAEPARGIGTLDTLKDITVHVLGNKRTRSAPRERGYDQQAGSGSSQEASPRSYSHALRHGYGIRLSKSVPIGVPSPEEASQPVPAP
jgi:hypothetical protein